jgi:arylsulfatase
VSNEIIAHQDWLPTLLATFQEFPPRMKAASFTIDQVMAKMEETFND